MIVAGIILMVAIGAGYVPLPPGSILVGSCSAAMSAACHVLPYESEDGVEVSQRKLMWGVVGTRSGGVGHCALSDKDVEGPQKGGLYAGMRIKLDNAS